VIPKKPDPGDTFPPFAATKYFAAGSSMVVFPYAIS
jgi:hypothetical protein